MTGYSLKGTISFVAMVLLIITALFSGEFGEAFYLIGMLVVGMVLYQVGRLFIRGVTGFDPDDGTTKRDREYIKKTMQADNNAPIYYEKHVQAHNKQKETKSERSKKQRIKNINDFLQKKLREEGLKEIDCIQAAAWLNDNNILADSESRPGKPLRDLLRDKQIVGAYQMSNRRWFIRCR